MKLVRTTLAAFAVLVPVAFAQQPPNQAKGINRPPDPRVQQRKYHFSDTNEDLPYAVFVSSKVSPDKKNPLIIALHGLGGDPNSLLRGKALDLAESGGYILVGPLGYNSGGWFGSPVIDTSGRGGKGPAGSPPPANLTELSEKDVMNVLDMIRKEFNVDERRTYLMGHSMGGAGTLFLGSKYAAKWAAIAAMAPAAFRMEPNRAEILGAITEPVLVLQGDADTTVPPVNTRRWAESMKEMKTEHKYIEIPGADHGTVIQGGMDDIFAFFDAHTK